MAGKRVSLASLAEAKVEAVPGASRPDLIHVPPNTVAPTPLNPRRAFDETELIELGEDMRAGQLQPCVAVNKAAYLKLYPEHADRLPDGCRYIMAAGERRWRAAAKVGLDSLDVMLRHDLTESRVRFLAAVLSENVQRANFNPIEEADGLRAMLDLHDGNQAAAARAMGKSKAWFNQRIGLLRLSDQMVELVFAGKLTAFRDMRRYAALPPGEQYTAWKSDQEQPRPPKPPQPEPPAAAPARDAGQPEAYTAVYAGPAEPAPAPDVPAVSGSSSGLRKELSPEPATAPVEPPAGGLERAEPAPGAPEALRPEPELIPDPRPEPSAEGRRFPYDSPGEAVMLLAHRMGDDAFFETVRLLVMKAADRNGGRLHGILRDTVKERSL
ncbi:ParB/RepB/Spo0J family partition protein [Streptomyces sp. NBRC 110035]|uniref:ParB/RepB/Spo0J family partition protein n=1 Tax=Streptomyces sp. NBRC 110035 TaxID=1547867 RepID=UPI0006964F2F|nr:ParB/RepB/Spo0J family partition protein [Streptomyces sp. NBRC 110035]